MLGCMGCHLTCINSVYTTHSTQLAQRVDGWWVRKGACVTTPAFGFSISPGTASGVATESREAERLGYARIGIWDSPALFREPWVVLAAMARDTNEIAIGTWVTNPLSRHPVVTASALASLDELAPGRVYLGIGTGGTGVLHLGLEAASLAQL